MANWWNTSYSFRRQLSIFPRNNSQPIQAGYPIYIELDYPRYIASNKLREDYADIEVVRHHLDAATPVEFATPADYVVAHKLVEDTESGVLQIIFNAEETITEFDDSYYIYYNNPGLINETITPPFSDSDFIVVTTPDDYNSNLTFSRPTEDWIDGISTKINARAALQFDGLHARLKLMKGPSRGIVELRVDDQDPIYIDSFSQVEDEQIVYTTSGLELGRHFLRLRVTGEKAPASDNYTIEIAAFEYSDYSEATLLGEEIYSSSGVFQTIVGP